MDVQRSPFKFLDAYEQDDLDQFFGREEDVDNLYELVFDSKLILLYGASGVGKTSIIQCGLANRFNPSQWMDIYVRKREDINTSLYHSVQSRIANTAANPDVPEEILEALNVLYLYNFKPIFLIFDQFEELFIFGTEEEQHQFFHFIQRILFSKLPVKVLLSMREEYIAHLSSFEKDVPSLFDHRLRIEKMTRANLIKVIVGTAQAFDIRIEEQEATVDAIIDNVSDKRGVDLTNLQVYLDRLYREDIRRRGGRESILFDPALVAKVGELQDVLGDFLEEQLNLLELELGKKDVPLDVLFALVTDDGTKRAREVTIVRESLHRRKQIPIEEIDYCIQRFSEMRIFKQIEE